MANEIGRQIPEEPNKQANPQFEAVKEWIKQPQNLMTMIVLGASMAQDRRQGQSKLDAFGERAIGTLGFRGEMQRRDEEDLFKNTEAEWKKSFEQGQLDVQNRQVDATRENTIADREVAMTQIGAQVGIAAENRLMQERLARMEEGWRMKIAEMEKSVAEMGKNSLFSVEDLQIARELYDSSLDSDAPMTFEEAMAKVMRPKLLLTNPQLLSFFEKPAAPPTPAPGPLVTPPVKRETRPGTRSKLTPAELRKSRTAAEVQAVKKAGEAVGGVVEGFGQRELERPKERF